MAQHGYICVYYSTEYCKLITEGAFLRLVAQSDPTAETYASHFTFGPGQYQRYMVEGREILPDDTHVNDWMRRQKCPCNKFKAHLANYKPLAIKKHFAMCAVGTELANLCKTLVAAQSL